MQHQVANGCCCSLAMSFHVALGRANAETAVSGNCQLLTLMHADVCNNNAGLLGVACAALPRMLVHWTECALQHDGFCRDYVACNSNFYRHRLSVFLRKLITKWAGSCTQAWGWVRCWKKGLLQVFQWECACCFFLFFLIAVSKLLNINILFLFVNSWHFFCNFSNRLQVALPSFMPQNRMRVHLYAYIDKRKNKCTVHCLRQVLAKHEMGGKKAK